MPKRLLLGPQRPQLILGEVIASAGLPEGPMAVIAAGWQEGEGDIHEIAQVVGRPVVGLNLYQRTEQVFSQAQTLREAYRARQDRLKRLQRLYRQRLRQLTLAARQTLRATEDRALIEPEQRHAMAQLRALDHHHLNRVEAIHAEFDQQLATDAKDLLSEHERQIDEALADCQTVIISGGHVAVLVNRLRLFQMSGRLASRHLVAWSAGAMALGQTVVLYHDRLPQGRREPEVLEHGANLVRDRILLPDPLRRLRASDSGRVGLFARRFAPARCLTLDSGAWLLVDGSEVIDSKAVRQLTRGGRAERMRR